MESIIGNPFKDLASPKCILFATDLTDSEYLLPYVVAQAQASDARVTLVHAIGPPSALSNGGPEVIPYIDTDQIIRDARLMLRRVAADLESKGINCDTVVREGEAGEVIRAEIARVHATRLVLGTHGCGKLGQLALGSVARELISSANIPLFLVGPHARNAVEHADPQKILLPVSLQGDYQQTLDFALALARMYKAELTLLHVLEPDTEEEVNPERTLEWAKHALEGLVAQQTDPHHVQTVVTTGKLADAVVKAAGQADSDWIVMGVAEGHRTWSFSESPAYEVLTKTTRPVLTLRHDQAQTGGPETTDRSGFAPSIIRT